MALHNTPVLGAKKNVIANIAVITNTITTPEGKLKVKLKNNPIIDEIAPINADTRIIVDNLFVSK